MLANRIDAELSAEQREKALAGLAMIVEALPFLIDLGPNERRRMAAYGERNRSFVSKALAIAEMHPEILPAHLGLAQFRADVELVERLYPLRDQFQTLCRRVDDTYFAAGSEAYATARLVYQYAKLHSAASGALASTIDDLGRRFVRKPRPPIPKA